MLHTFTQWRRHTRRVGCVYPVRKIHKFVIPDFWVIRPVAYLKIGALNQKKWRTLPIGLMSGAHSKSRSYSYSCYSLSQIPGYATAFTLRDRRARRAVPRDISTRPIANLFLLLTSSYLRSASSPNTIVISSSFSSSLIRSSSAAMRFSRTLAPLQRHVNIRYTSTIVHVWKYWT